MPIYTFYCEKCSHYFEKSRPMAEAERSQHCPLCQCIAQRDYASDNIRIAEGPKTLGSLADKNASKFGSEQKKELQDSLIHRKKNESKN